MIIRKSPFLILAVIGFFLRGQKSNQAFGAENKLPREIEVRRYFHSYNYHIDWNALVDLKNNPILNACILGTTSSELESLHLPDLTIRLQKLQRGNLIKKTGTRYHLNFPAIIDRKQADLEKIVGTTALKLMPTAEKTTHEVAAHLKGREQMLYHFVWSIIMDGHVAWSTLETGLKRQLKKDDASIGGIAWFQYPNHPYRAGTNTYGDLHVGTVFITWSLTTPMPPDVHRIIKEYESELFQSIDTAQPVENQNARQALAQYGLVDEKSMSRVYIINPDSEVAHAFGKISRRFADEVMTHLDVQKAAKTLGTTSVEALVIIYHELCYVLLEKLASKKILEIPEIVLRPDVDFNQAYRLISIADLRESNLSDR